MTKRSESKGDDVFCLLGFPIHGSGHEKIKSISKAPRAGNNIEKFSFLFTCKNNRVGALQNI